MSSCPCLCPHEKDEDKGSESPQPSWDLGTTQPQSLPQAQVSTSTLGTP